MVFGIIPDSAFRFARIPISFDGGEVAVSFDQIPGENRFFLFRFGECNNTPGRTTKEPLES
jgi:hypothetical protein